MYIHKNIPFLALVVYLSSCASENYIQPEESQPYAMITNGERTGDSQFNWSSFFVQEIDGVEVSYNKEFWSGNGAMGATRRVSPGTHELLIRATFVRSLWGGGPYYQFILLEAVLLDQVEYLLVGDVNDTGIKAWLVNKQTGDIASPVGTTRIENMPKQ